MRVRLLALSLLVASLIYAAPAVAQGHGSLFTSPTLATCSKVPKVLPGSWVHSESYGYVWVPDLANSMWSPWDAIGWGSWVWVDQVGWGWTPLEAEWSPMMSAMSVTSVSPLGWGYDSWYGGWYTTLANGYIALLGDPYNDPNPRFCSKWPDPQSWYQHRMLHQKPATTQAQIVLLVPSQRIMRHDDLLDSHRGGAHPRGSGYSNGAAGGARPHREPPPGPPMVSTPSVMISSPSHTTSGHRHK